MSYYGLLNKNCSYARRINIGTNVYGEIQFTEQIISSSAPCRRNPSMAQGGQKLIERSKEGTANVKLVTYFMRYSETIQEGDLINLSDTNQGVVKNILDAAGKGHHKQLLVEEVEEVGEKDKTSG